MIYDVQQFHDEQAISFSSLQELIKMETVKELRNGHNVIGECFP
jgi:hypothetical protein